MIEPAKVKRFLFRTGDGSEVEIETIEDVRDPVRYAKRFFPTIRKQEVVCVRAY